MSNRIATNIETELWNDIIEKLKKESWEMISEYENFDKGIDFDLYEFKKDNEKIVLAWDNWTEGEIKCKEEILKSLEEKMNVKFQFGKPENLSESIFETIKKSLKRK